jgi:hypothetical protein
VKHRLSCSCIKRSSNGPRALTFQQRLMSRKDERICNGAFFYFEWRTSRNTWNRFDMKSSECAAELQSCNWFVFSLCRPVCSKYLRVVHSNHSQNEDQQPLCATAQLQLHCTIRRRNTSLHVNCTRIVRIADINFKQNTSLIIFVFRLMTV